MELVRKQTDGSLVGRHGKQVASCVATEPEASVSHYRLHVSAFHFPVAFPYNTGYRSSEGVHRVVIAQSV
jgi:hypothetical protein